MVLDVAAKIVPILLLILLGAALRAKAVIAEPTVEDLKKIVVNVALPSVFFVSFLKLELNVSDLWLAALIIGVCAAQYFYGRGIARLFGIGEAYFPFLATGFEFGMVGITLFGSGYGLDNLGAISVIGLGHEFFVWFVLVALLTAHRDGRASMAKTLGTFVSSPVIISIMAGIVCNLLGLGKFLFDFMPTAAILAAADYLAKLTIPLILIIIGYGLAFTRRELGRSAVLAAARLALLVPAALILNAYLVRRLLGLDPLFERALFTFMILPPPYIIPLYIKEGNREDRAYANTALMLHTAVTIGVFIVYMFLTAGAH